MKRFAYISLLVLISFLSQAQQDPQIDQYVFNPLVINPAYAGHRDMIAVSLLNRIQWASFEGAPTTQTFSIHGPFRSQNMGLGFTIINDKIGPSANTSISGCYAYRLKLKTGKIAFGLRAGGNNYRFNWDDITYKDQSEYIVNVNRSSAWVANFDFGMNYSSKTFYGGIALAHLNNPTLKLDSLATYNSEIKNQLIIMVGKAIEANPSLVLKPSIFLKSSGSATVLDLSWAMLFSNTIWTSFTYKSSKAIAFNVEYAISEMLRCGYAYDVTFTNERPFGSHEFFLGIDLGSAKPKMLSPRYF